MIYLKDFVCAFGATLFFCILFSAPRRSILFSALVAGVSWLFYDLIKLNNQNELVAYFVAVLFISILSEWGARYYKMPSIIILFPGLIPYVPGIGIYRAMLYMVTNDFNMFISTLVNTLLIAASIAVAVAMVNIFMALRRAKKLGGKQND